MPFLSRAASALFATILATSASASIISFTGDIGQIADADVPANITDSAPADATQILSFNEKQNVLLDQLLDPLFGADIAAGTRVDSHMVFLNKPDGVGGTLDFNGTITFSGTILGVFGRENGADLAGLNGRVDTDSLLGVSNYDNFANRGMENNGTGANNDSVSFLDDTLTIRLKVTQPGDWVRVVTASAVPLPAPVLLFGSGFAVFAAMRRRKSKQ